MPVRFLVNILEGSGDFTVCEGGAVLVSGKVRLPEDAAAERLPLEEPAAAADEPGLLPLAADDIYKELRLRGYNYAGAFRGIRGTDARGMHGELEWTGNWVSFMDTILQFGIVGDVQQRELYLPTRVQRVVIDPAAQRAAAAAGAARAVRWPDVGVSRAGGVEFRGVTASLAPRRLNPQPPPKLEKFVFVPYDSAAPAADDPARARLEALTACLQLVLENAGTLRLKATEAALERPAEALLAPLALEVLQGEPQVRVECSLAAPPGAAPGYAALQDLGIKVRRCLIPLSSKNRFYFLIFDTHSILYNRFHISHVKTNIYTFIYIYKKK